MTGQTPLTAEEVFRLLDFMAGCDPIIVGGQSVNLLVQHYAPRDASLVAMGPFTSNDLDIYANKEAVARLASNLANATILTPDIGDASPNFAVVIGNLGSRRVVVDFMAVVLGVEQRSIHQNYVALEGTVSSLDKTITLLVMNPLDCLRSRLSNVNTLHRHDEQSLRQAEASIKILRHFVDDLLAMHELKMAQRLLRELEFVIRDQHLGKDTHKLFGHRLNVFEVAEAFVEDERLDSRWRTLVLINIVLRQRARADRIAGQVNAATGRLKST